MTMVSPVTKCMCSITVNTTAGPDTINYTPLSFGSARITRSQGGPQINISQFNDVDGNLDSTTANTSCANCSLPANRSTSGSSVWPPA